MPLAKQNSPFAWRATVLPDWQSVHLSMILLPSKLAYFRVPFDFEYNDIVADSLGHDS